MSQPTCPTCNQTMQPYSLTAYRCPACLTVYKSAATVNVERVDVQQASAAQA